MNKTFHYIGTTGIVILIISIFASLGYGGWILQKKINYKFGYQSEVRKEVEKAVVPLIKRIEELEKKVNLVTSTNVTVEIIK
jgi:hypothetical protein